MKINYNKETESFSLDEMSKDDVNSLYKMINESNLEERRYWNRIKEDINYEKY